MVFVADCFFETFKPEFWISILVDEKGFVIRD